MEIFYEVLFYLGWVSIFSGIFFLLLSGFGIIRMPDSFTRIHAGTKATTLGSFLTIIGVGLINPAWFLKTLVLAVFILITNPISSSVLTKGAYISGTKFVNKSNIDMCKECSELNNERIEALNLESENIKDVNN